MNEIAREARKRLLDRRKALRQLMGEVDDEEAQLQDGPRPDALDTASERTPIAVLESLRDAQRHELDELEAALERIDKGIYGACQMCGGAVGRQRLRAIPEARYCIDCVSTRTRIAATS